MTDERKASILLVDDDVNVLKALNRALTSYLCDIEMFQEAEKALDRAREAAFDLVICDYRMPQMNGIQFLTALREQRPHTVRIMISGDADMAAVAEAVNQAEIYRLVTKPWTEGELRTTVAHALMNHFLVQDRMAINELMEHVRDRLDRQDLFFQRLRADLESRGSDPGGEIPADDALEGTARVAPDGHLSFF